MKTLKVVLDPCQSPGIFSAKIWIREGSRADPTKQKGIHNLLGSLLSRGCGSYSNLEVADLIEGHGASLTCETYEDGLMVSLKCIQDSSPKLIRLLNLIITEPLLKKDQVDLERNLSILAINRQNENPFNIAFNQWKKIAYSNHPYMHETLGVKQDLKGITRENIISLSKDFISREKIVLFSGSLPKNVENYIPNIKEICLLDNVSIYSSPKINIIPKTNQNALVKQLIIKPQETNQVVLILGKSTIPYSNPDDLKLRLLSSHLGSGMSSVLFRILREENGLSYDVGLYHPIREYQAPFLIHASSSTEKAKLTLKKIFQCWKNIIKHPISDQELTLAKAKFLGNIAHNSQTISQRAERKAYLMGLGLNINHDLNSIQILKKITSEELLDSASKYLKHPILSLCGPKDELENLKAYWEVIRNQDY